MYLRQVHFRNNEVPSNWYNGSYHLYYLHLWDDDLLTIRANAFNCSAFREIFAMSLSVPYTALKIHRDAFQGLDKVYSVSILAKRVASLPPGLFHKMATALWVIRCSGWPSDVSMEEMFANHRYRITVSLLITQVRKPQWKFRLLDASNFTSFSRLEQLRLIDCGIEVIGQHAFKVIGRTLNKIVLNKNRIKVISFEMMHRLFESKLDMQWEMHSPRESLICTCKLVELRILICPFHDENCFECDETQDLDQNACQITYRRVDIAEFCIDFVANVFLHYFGVDLTVVDDVIDVQTNITNRYRMVFVNLDGMGAKKCINKAAAGRFKCFIVRTSVGNWHLKDIDEVRDAEFVSINAIPMLYHFGMWPMHTIVVRRDVDVGGSDDWLKWLLIATGVSLVWFAIVTIIVHAIGIGMIRDEPEENSQEINLKRLSYDYPLAYQISNQPLAAAVNADTNYYLHVY